MLKMQLHPGGPHNPLFNFPASQKPICWVPLLPYKHTNFQSRDFRVCSQSFHRFPTGLQASHFIAVPLSCLLASWGLQSRAGCHRVTGQQQHSWPHAVQINLPGATAGVREVCSVAQLFLQQAAVIIPLGFRSQFPISQLK